ncbi:MAG TPA: Flp pilus assembly protein CpaB [Dermatophilaceae bacterium]|nr:Flp pilus assembly protein CpaB [Dermatophilaceae bacterium]
MPRRVLAVILSLALALLGAVGVVAYAQAADARAQAGQRLATVYITTGTIPAGTSVQAALTSGLMVPESVIAKGVPAGAMPTTGEDATARGAKVALSNIAPGEIVLSARFGATADQTSNAAIPAGTVAVTVRLEDPQRSAPLLTPGSHVVIYDTFNPANAKAGSLTPDGRKLAETPGAARATRIVLSDVTVIAVGATTVAAASASGGQSAEQQSTQSAALVTVAVKPADAIALVHAAQTGTLYAALRGQGVTVDPMATVTDGTVLTGR